jgi:hypothetical protein
VQQAAQLGGALRAAARQLGEVDAALDRHAIVTTPVAARCDGHAAAGRRGQQQPVRARQRADDGGVQRWEAAVAAVAHRLGLQLL